MKPVSDRAVDAILAAHGVTVSLPSGTPVVEDVSITLRRGETLGVVGESGSGKTTLSLALMGYARDGMRITAGSMTITGQQVDLCDEVATERLRGRVLSHVPQDPATNLNPSLRIGPGVNDILLEHCPKRAGDEAVSAALRRVDLPSDRAFRRRYPHELSGGQQQRVLISMALVAEPDVVLLDEPTTGLDTVTQARVLEEIGRLHRERGVAMVYVSHDLAVISQIADRIAVMYAGRIVEEGATEQVLSRPRHPYTRGLIAATPDHSTARRLVGIPGVAVGLHDRPTGCSFAPRCPQRIDACGEAMPDLRLVDNREVRCIQAERTPPLELAPLRRADTSGAERPVLAVEQLTLTHRGRGGMVIAAQDVSFEVMRGECVALVGESGSGKTTIARAIAGLHPPENGRVLLDGEELTGRARRRSREARQRCQIIFQNPYESLNPRQRVGAEISRPARILRGLSRQAADNEVARLLERVRLPLRVREKYPGELSGGERQRVAIARALAAEPAMMICDEITSALDVSVQAAVVELLSELRDELGLSLLFITHNLGVVASLADRTLILDGGLICEEGATPDVLTRPRSRRGIELLEAAPRLEVGPWQSIQEELAT